MYHNIITFICCIITSLHLSVESPLFKLSFAENVFTEEASLYQEALKRARRNHKLSYNNHFILAAIILLYIIVLTTVTRSIVIVMVLIMIMIIIITSLNLILTIIGIIMTAIIFSIILIVIKIRITMIAIIIVRLKLIVMIMEITIAIIIRMILIVGLVLRIGIILLLILGSCCYYLNLVVLFLVGSFSCSRSSLTSLSIFSNCSSTSFWLQHWFKNLFFSSLEWWSKSFLVGQILFIRSAWLYWMPFLTILDALTRC